MFVYGNAGTRRITFRRTLMVSNLILTVSTIGRTTLMISSLDTIFGVIAKLRLLESDEFSFAVNE